MTSIREVARQAAIKVGAEVWGNPCVNERLEAVADAVTVAVLQHVLANFHGFWPNDVRYSIEKMLAECAAPAGPEQETKKAEPMAPIRQRVLDVGRDWATAASPDEAYLAAATEALHYVRHAINMGCGSMGQNPVLVVDGRIKELAPHPPQAPATSAPETVTPPAPHHYGCKCATCVATHFSTVTPPAQERKVAERLKQVVPGNTLVQCPRCRSFGEASGTIKFTCDKCDYYPVTAAEHEVKPPAPSPSDVTPPATAVEQAIVARLNYEQAIGEHNRCIDDKESSQAERQACWRVRERAWEHVLAAVRQESAAEIERLTKELAVTDSLLNDRQRVLDAVPPCPSHGPCVPHAVEWITKQAALAATSAEQKL